MTKQLTNKNELRTLTLPVRTWQKLIEAVSNYHDAGIVRWQSIELEEASLELQKEFKSPSKSKKPSITHHRLLPKCECGCPWS